MASVEALQLFQSTFAVSLSNLDSSRTRNTSKEARKEGWTEEWGLKASTTAAEHADSFETQQISSLLSTSHPQSPLTLVQYRPAWLEQLVLRMASVPHIVINSRYPATESTGSLPYIRHITAEQPCLVGRHEPTSGGGSGNDIIKYLQRIPQVVALAVHVNDCQRSQAHLIQTLIVNELEPALVALRFLNDDAWTQIYRPQYMAASSGVASKPFFHLGAAFSAWSIRTVHSKKLKNSWSVQRAQKTARKCYATLNTILENLSKTLLNTTSPTLLDALLWSHLADALVNVDLCTMLADYPNLVDFYTTIHKQYFLPSSSDSNEWRVWNDATNAENAFCRWPVVEKSPEISNPTTDLMQSLEKLDLQHLLTEAKSTRREETRSVIKRRHHLHQWLMGGDLVKAKEDEPTDAQKKWREDHKANDELWLSAVVGATILTLVFGAQGGGE